MGIWQFLLLSSSLELEPIDMELCQAREMAMYMFCSKGWDALLMRSSEPLHWLGFLALSREAGTSWWGPAARISFKYASLSSSTRGTWRKLLLTLRLSRSLGRVSERVLVFRTLLLFRRDCWCWGNFLVVLRLPQGLGEVLVGRQRLLGTTLLLRSVEETWVLGTWGNVLFVFRAPQGLEEHFLGRSFWMVSSLMSLSEAESLVLDFRPPQRFRRMI